MPELLALTSHRSLPFNFRIARFAAEVKPKIALDKQAGSRYSEVGEGRITASIQ